MLACRTNGDFGKAIALLAVLETLDRFRQSLTKLLSRLQIMLQQVIRHAARCPDTYTREAFKRLYECK
jgi:hypothetical protein